MSVPARRLSQPAPRRVPSRRSPKPSPDRSARRSTGRDASRRPARRRIRRPFLALASALFVTLVFGFVSLSVLLAQDALRLASLEDRVAGLIGTHGVLVGEEAALRSPERIVDWGHRHGLVIPAEVRFVPVDAP